MNRREFLIAGALATLARRPARGDEVLRTSLGIVPNTVTRSGPRPVEPQGEGESWLVDDPVEFLAFCRERGAGGVQLDLGARDYEHWDHVKAVLAENAMFLEGSITLAPERHAARAG